MIKYIDKESALQHLTDRLMKSALNNIGIKIDADEAFREIAENRLPVWLDELQTYDVKEETHGHWEKVDDNPYEYVAACSVCRNEVKQPTCMLKPIYSYCPICGARMDEVEE